MLNQNDLYFAEIFLLSYDVFSMQHLCLFVFIFIASCFYLMDALFYLSEDIDCNLNNFFYFLYFLLLASFPLCF